MAQTTTIFIGGTVLVDVNLDGEYPITSDAIAFKGGRVVALDDEARALAHGDAEVIDLKGDVIIPALGDGHAHPLLAGLETLGPAVREAADRDGILEAVRVWREEHPDAAWIVGGSYDATFAPNGLFDAKWLDEVTGGTPTILRSWDYHTAWVNTAALRAGGVTAETPDPPLGRYVRREDGSPLGTLQETAANHFLENVAPPFSLEDRVSVLELATKRYAEHGITWVQDAWVDPQNIEVYVEAARTDRLHTRLNMALRADPQDWREQVAEFVRIRAEIRDLGKERLTAETVKFFLDGVIESHTASLIEPYTDRPGERGIANWSLDELIPAARAFAEEGFQLHLHAIGDAANRVALDALEAIADIASPERPNVVAHIAVLHPDDVERFAQLDIIANFEPYWAQCDAVMKDLTIPRLGETREEWQYLIGSVHRSGATVTFGSDWPVTTEDWRPALAVAIDRREAGDPNAESWLPEERVDARTALAGYTTGIARQALVVDRGTLRVGSAADAVWLSRNPLDTPVDDIPAIEVRGTWLAGERTYTPADTR